MALRDLKHSTKPPHQYSCFEKGIFNGFGPIFVFEIERSEPRRHFTFKFQVDVGVLGVGVVKLGVSRLPYRFQSDTAISDGISGVSTGPNEVPPVHHCSSPSHPKTPTTIIIINITINIIRNIIRNFIVMVMIIIVMPVMMMMMIYESLPR